MFYNLVPFVRGTNFERSTKRQVCYNCVKLNCPVLGQIKIQSQNLPENRFNVAGQSSKSWPILAEITCTLARDNLPPNNLVTFTTCLLDNVWILQGEVTC